MNGLAAACFAFRRSGWEAAVGGGIPCIKALKEGIAANNITYAAGIMNGAQHLAPAMVLPLPLSLEQS